MQSCFLGIRNSKYKTCLIMDGDLQDPPELIAKNLNDIEILFFLNE